ncbi:hypothetical protein [Micropruina sp.]|uniref:hypothetical protein n=1 Tax=Micropruina sp. TaxID=2737536 RepID=UPI0039E38526
MPLDGGWGLAIESAGLRVVEVRTILDEQPPPAADQTRLIAGALLRRYLGEDFDDLVSDDDRATVRWLLDPNNPAGHRAPRRPAPAQRAVPMAMRHGIRKHLA